MTLFKMEWHTSRQGLAWWSGSVVLILILFMSVFPAMQTEGMQAVVDSKLGGLPTDLLKVFHLSDGPSLLEPVGYFGYIFQYVFMAVCVYAALLGSKALVKEETDGTIEFLYGQPISRRRIVGEKFIATLSMLVVLWAITFSASLGTLIFFDYTDTEFSVILEELLKIMVPEFFVLMFFLAMGFLLSSLLGSAKQSTGSSLSLVFGLYLLGILGDLQSQLGFLKAVSPLAQGMPSQLLAADFAYPLMGVLLLTSLIGVGATVLVYGHKDLQI